ncbi:hypothetical protein ABWH96_07310 [Marivirga tractuosa]|jgi:hypothetical protein|uniref:hypothetical protein n=1 Tax=Marivirga tractuosa TaxID=1006 RepID=UPI0035D0BF27
MEKKKKFKLTGLKVRLFASLMVITVLGLLLKTPILYPLELIFNRTTEYTSTNYSYKPGQSGYTFDFYILNDDHLFVHLSTGLVMILVFLFYVGLFSGISAFLLVTRQKLKAAKRDIIITIIIAAALFGLPQLISWDTLLGINDRGDYMVKDRVFTPNNGTWEIGNQKLKGVSIENNRTNSSDTSVLKITKLKDGQSTPLFSEKVTANGAVIVTEMYGDTLWVFGNRGQYIKAYNTATEEILFQNKDELLKMYNVASSGRVESFRGPHANFRENCVFLTTNEGKELYLLLDRGIITENKPAATHNHPKFYLRNQNRHRSKVVAYKRTDLPKFWEDKVFLEAEILKYTDEVIIIRSKPNISEGTRHSITAYSIKDAEELWKVNEEEISFLEKIYGKVRIKIHQTSSNTMLNFYDTFTLKGTLHVDAKGKITGEDGTLDIFNM